MRRLPASTMRRANCMALIREFDLDFVMTSEREWGCYPELPGLSICQLTRREGMDAVLVTRWSLDGRERRAQHHSVRRFPHEAEAAGDDARSSLPSLRLVFVTSMSSSTQQVDSLPPQLS